MKILYFSTSPHIGVGYGVTTREIVRRMKEDGHEVKVATKHHMGGQLIIDGIECIDGTEPEVINEVIRRDGYDYIISINDSWAFSAYNAAKAFTKEKWAMTVFLDTEWIHYHMINIAKESSFQMCVTKHGEKEMRRVGFYPYYTPLGVDTKVFKPDPALREQFRKKKGWTDDKFVIGFVGINYPTDRKNIINLIKAFQKFHTEFPNSELYLHTDIIGSATNGNSLQWILGSCGFDPNGAGAIKIVDQVDYHLWNIARDELVGLYNAFDTFCFPSHGEGFGLPLVEAQACGCPTITTDTTSGRELTKGGLLIPVSEDDYMFSSLRTWVARVPATKIYKSLKSMYKIWEAKKLGKYQKNAREGMLEYDWDVVYSKYWRPFLQVLSDKIDLKKINESYPEYGYLHRQMIGRIMFAGKFDCGIEQPECKKVCDWVFPLLYKEPYHKRPLLSRSYPIFPNKDGELVIDMKCRFSRWITPRFSDEVTVLWEELWTYPRIRDQVRELWDSGYFDKGDFKLLKDIPHEFDASYAEVMQKYYETQFRMTPDLLEKLKTAGNTIVDVGCGKGVRVDALNEKGFVAIGTEVNKVWINDKTIFYGDINNLPYPDNHFHTVMCVDVLEHMDEPLKALKELFRISSKYLVLEITTTSDGSLTEDATHKVRWNPFAWEREISELGVILERLSGQSWLIEKK